MSDLISYFNEFMADIRYDADISGIMMVEAFFEKVKERLTEAGEVETADRAFYEFGDGAQRLRIDGYGGDPRDAEGVLGLVVCDFKDTEKLDTFGKADLPPLFNPLVRFLKKARQADFRDSLNEVSPGFQISDLVIATWSHVSKIKLILVSNREYVGKADAIPFGEIDGIPITYNVWDLARLEKWDRTGQAVEDRVIDFAGEFGGALPALRASRVSERLESYLLVIPGPQLAAVYDKWGARLLEANVRSFLQAKAGTNKGIARTIRETPDLFFAFNNGISATADAVTFSEASDGLKISSIANLQIVNGGQTTGSIHAALKTAKENLGDVFVQMKLTVVPAELSEEIVPKISEYANTQNKVNAADFFSNHPFHVRMQEFSRTIIAPRAEGSRHETKWFYERARGQYLDERTKRSDAQRKKFELENPKTQLFSKTDLAKFEMSAIGQPYVVATGPQKNFAKFAGIIGQDWAKSPASAAKYDEVWFKRLIAKGIIYNFLWNNIPKQPWFEDYRPQISTYAMAKVFHDVGEMDGKVLDLDGIWRKQVVAEPLTSALLVAAEAASRVILAPPPGMRNLSEWAKRQACWAELSGFSLSYNDDFEDCLVSKDEARTEVRQVRAERSMMSGIEAQIRVTGAGQAFWASLSEWGRANRKLSPKEMKTLESCAAFHRRMPTDSECQQAVLILNRLEADGFVA